MMKEMFSGSSGKHRKAEILIQGPKKGPKKVRKKNEMLQKKKINREWLSEWEKRQQKDKVVPVSISNVAIQLEFILHLFWGEEQVPQEINTLRLLRI